MNTFTKRRRNIIAQVMAVGTDVDKLESVARASRHTGPPLGLARFQPPPSPPTAPVVTQLAVACCDSISAAHRTFHQSAPARATTEPGGEAPVSLSPCR